MRWDSASAAMKQMSKSVCVKIAQARVGCRQDGSLVAQARIDWHRGYTVLAPLERERETCSRKCGEQCFGAPVFVYGFIDSRNISADVFLTSAA